METTLQPEKEIITEELVNFALSEVERKYGTGKGDGLTPLDYHNLPHSQDSHQAGEKIAKLAARNGKISPDDVGLVKIAAASHDIEQGLNGEGKEEESARIIEVKMREKSVYTEEDIEKVKKMILATATHVENGAMKQSATDDYLTQIMADADLAYLGGDSETYYQRAESLLKEIKRTDNPTSEDKLAFMKSQPAFLAKHSFYTEEARQLFPNKQVNIAFVQAKLQCNLRRP